MDYKSLFLLCLVAYASGTPLPLKNGHVYHSVKLAEFGTIDVSFAFQQSDGLKTIDAQRILDLHNVLRAKIASGQELESWNGNNQSPKKVKMPPAANMQAVEWDDRLAKYAQDWADTCKQGHSKLNSNSIPGYSEFNLGENLSGDITFLEKDMYGEVRWWNFDKFSCQSAPNAQCGHYLNFAGWGFSRIGCGWKICKDPGGLRHTLVCLYAGVQNTAKEDGKKRMPLQHEYLKGAPCSACEQGWDYCMGGGLCATKKQCESSKKNDCKCNTDSAACAKNGGTFIPGTCSCKCPANKMGRNCESACKNSFETHCGMDCGADVLQAFFCQKTCGGCGRATSTAYDFWFKKHKTVDSKKLAVRTYFENPDSQADSFDMKKLPDYGKCENKGSQRSCTILMLRGYCKDGLFGSSIRSYCALSCSDCDEQKKKKEEADKASAAYGFGDVGNVGNLDLSGKPELTSAQINAFKDIPGLAGLDLSGFKIVR